MAFKDEAYYRDKCLAELRAQQPSWVIQIHQDVRHSGVPDVSVTGLGFTSWWEFKHATPDITGTGYQELQCLRLAAHGFCRYVVYFDYDGVKKTLIVHPKNIGNLTPEVEAMGHDHAAVVRYITHVHMQHATGRVLRV